MNGPLEVVPKEIGLENIKDESLRIVELSEELEGIGIDSLRKPAHVSTFALSIVGIAHA